MAHEKTYVICENMCMEEGLTKEEIDGTYAKKTAVEALASGSPKGTYATSAALKTANPDTGVYIATSNGHVYGWTKNQSGDPVDLGAYQAGENSDNVNALINMFKNSENVLNNLVDMQRGYISSSGVIETDEGGSGYTRKERTSGYINVTAGQKVTFIQYVKNNVEQWNAIGCWNGNTFITRIVGTIKNTYTLHDGSKINVFEYTIPNNTTRIRYAYRKYNDEVKVRMMFGEITNYTGMIYSFDDNKYIDEFNYASQFPIKFSRGSLDRGNEIISTQRIVSDYIYLKKGTKITTFGNNEQFSVHRYTSEKVWIGETGWRYDTYELPEDGYVRIILVKGMASSFNIISDDEIEGIKKKLFISNLFTETDIKNIKDLSNTIEGINDDIEGINNDIEALNGTIYFNNKVKSVNHRGFNTVAPENTLPAYKLSKKKGFVYVETDVSFTSDNIPVLLHDSSINRTARNSNGTTISETIIISNITYEQALNYDFGIWKNQIYAGTKIPTFEQFIKLCRDIGLKPYIEIKTSPTPTQEQIQLLVNIVKKYQMLDECTWISFSTSVLTMIKNILPKARLGRVTEALSSSAINEALTLKTEANEVFMDAQYNITTSENITLCYNQDLPLEVWNVFTEQDVLNANSYISGFTADSLLATKVLYDNSMV